MISKKPSLPLCLALPFCLVLATGCVSVRTRYVHTLSALRDVRSSIVSSSDLSPPSQQLLRMAGVDEDQVLSGAVSFDPDTQLLEPAIKRFYLHSELALARAMHGRTKDDKLHTVGNYLAAADYALKGSADPECKVPLNVLCDNMKLFYLRALLGLTEYLNGNHWDADRQMYSTSTGRSYTLQLASDTQYEDPRIYTSILPSTNIGIEGLVNRHIRYGIGLALTACRPKRPNVPEDQFLPLVGTCLPLTAVLQFKEPGAPTDAIPANLALHSALRSESVNVDGRSVPLAANFSAPLASIIEKTGRTPFADLLGALSSSEEYLQKQGFYCLAPYDAGKIPLVTVHGLFSSPLTWISVQNDLTSDELIRKNFQIWHYLYPTNLPILENAKTFRQKLDDLEAHLQASAGSPRRGMVIIAHSMGGLLTKTAVAGNVRIMRELLLDPSAQLDSLDPKVRADLDRYLNIERKSYIDRVIFVAVPHRGSSIADNWIGRIGRSLISLPQMIAQDVSNVIAGAGSVFRPELKRALQGNDLSSIRGLSPTNPVINALAQVPVAYDVPFHSIIGDRGKGDSPASSDGVVLYTSSHLDGAKSELIVPADHSAHLNAIALQEIRRILRLHLDELNAAQSMPPAAGAALPIK